VRTYQIRHESLSAAESWMAEQRRLWERRLDQLGQFLEALDAAETPKRTKEKR
jgi:hypothetical protein